MCIDGAKMKEKDLIKKISDYLKTVDNLFFGRNTAVSMERREFLI